MCTWFLCAGVLAQTLLGASADIERARKLYNQTDFDGSLQILQALPAKTGEVYELAGQNYFMMGEYKKATESFEKAVAADPASSAYRHWLGRAFGRRAETASPFTAPGLASKARQNFEKAVEFDPKNLEAMNDLFEYYLEAPRFLGGGLDKAAALSAQIAKLNASEGHWAQAKISEKRKEFGNAEQQLRRAVEMAPQQIGRFVDLAKFLSKQGRYQESDLAFQRAEKIDPNSPKLLFSRAEAYIHAGRNLDAARELLKRYLATSLTPDDPPRSEAQKLLSKASAAGS